MAGRPRLIPEDLYPEILQRSGQRQSSDVIAGWLTEKLGKKVDGRTVRLTLSRIRAERAPIAQAIVQEELRPKVIADLNAIDKLLTDAGKFQADASKLQKLEAEAELIAHSNIADCVSEAGSILDLKKMPEAVQKTIASIEVFEEFEGEGAMRRKIGETVKLKLWEKSKGIDAAAKLKSGHMAMQAMAMQKSLLELRFRLSGAGGGKDQPDGVVVLGPEGD